MPVSTEGKSKGRERKMEREKDGKGREWNGREGKGNRREREAQGKKKDREGMEGKRREAGNEGDEGMEARED